MSLTSIFRLCLQVISDICNGRFRNVKAVLRLSFRVMPDLIVKVVPGASKDELTGRFGQGVKVRVSAPAEKGRANRSVIDVLAHWLGIPCSAIELISGPRNPRKIFRISGLGEMELAEKLKSLQQS